MAEVVTGAMHTLLPKLGDLLKEEYELQRGVRGEITFLKAELESIQTALLKVSEAPMDQPPDIQVILWARDVKELSYDIEDNIDKFMVHIDTTVPTMPHSLVQDWCLFRGCIDWCLDQLTKFKIRHNIGTDIRNIKSRIKEVSERRDRYKVDNLRTKPVGPTTDSLRRSTLYKKATELVGTDEKSDGLIKMLMEGDEEAKQQPKIVSIVGFGGLGKTTLAYVVHEKLKMQFDCRAFVHVSLNLDMEIIMKKMLYQLQEVDEDEDKRIAMWDEGKVFKELSKFLQDKRYFIVLDDIWDISTWGLIKNVLVNNERRSKIIITTRNLDVAEQVGGVYRLEPLSFVESRKLFLQTIFGVEDECPSQLAEVSKKILTKCGGIPLAITMIANLLASKKKKRKTLKYWSEVYQSIGSGLKDSFDIMRRILYLSYYDLPPHLKTCLLYLSLYPQGYEITTDDLIWKWVGEGFVHNEQGKSLKEVGGDYLDELINKSLIQPGDIGTDNEAKTCRVHDMMLDLITSLSNEEHFLTAFGRQQPMSVPSKIRRLSLQTSNEDNVRQASTMSLSHVRSLTVFDKEAFSLLPALSSFQVLRALDLGGCRQVKNHHCKDICNLFHLRYLVLRNTSVSEIPIEIGNLQFLQVLYITWKIKELPSTFLQLGQLVYLDVDSSTRLPDGFGNLKSLQELHRISIRSPTMLYDLARLTELRHLAIMFHEWDERYEEPFLQCYSNLASLEILQMYTVFDVPLRWRCENLSPGPQELWSIDMAMCTIHTVPRWMSSLSSLSSLRISLEKLGVGDLQVLGSIPSLGDLTIFQHGRGQRLVIGSDYPFWCLTRLSFWTEGTLEVVFAPGAMQKLQTLVLRFDRFDDFEFGLENLSSLGHVSLRLGMSPDDGDVEAAFRKTLEANPNNPTLEFVMLLS